MNYAEASYFDGAHFAHVVAWLEFRRLSRIVRQAAPRGRRYRVSSDSVWPLRDASGKTWAERKESRQWQA